MSKVMWQATSVSVAAAAIVYTLGFSPLASSEYRSQVAERFIPLPTLDTVDYDARLLALAHAGASTTLAFTGVIPLASTTSFLWPVKNKLCAFKISGCQGNHVPYLAHINLFKLYKITFDFTFRVNLDAGLKLWQAASPQRIVSFP